MFRHHLLLLLSTTAALVAGDVVSIQNALNALNQGLQRVDIAAIGIPNGTFPALAVLMEQAPALLQNASQVIAASPPLNLADTQSLGVAISALQMNVNLSITDLMAQKPLIDAAGQTQTVLQGVQDLRDAGLGVWNTLMGKLDLSAPGVVTAATELISVL